MNHKHIVLAVLIALAGCKSEPEQPQELQVPTPEKQAPTRLLPSNKVPKLLSESIPKSKFRITRKRTDSAKRMAVARIEAAPTPQPGPETPQDVTNERYEFENMVALYGNLHSHSELSDDIGNPGPGMTPGRGPSLGPKTRPSAAS